MNSSPNRILRLEAYNGIAIPNSIEPDPTPGVVALAKQAFQMHLLSAVSLTPATGRYNCHGLVFASRRTGIPPSNLPNAVDIDDLLKHDHYLQVDTSQVGDIVVYRGTNGKVEHTGIVSRVNPLGTLPITMVWSKWGTLGGYEHSVYNSPYNDCKHEFWRLA